MNFGNYMPISKALIKFLPNSRPLSEVEAAYSLQFAYDQNQLVQIAGLAKRWKWDRKKVRRFLKAMNVEIIRDCSIHDPEKGAQLIPQLPTQLKGQLRLIDNKGLLKSEQTSFYMNSN